MFSSILSLLFGLTCFSMVSVVIYSLQMIFTTQHRHRILFLKANLIITWLIVSCSLILFFRPLGLAHGGLVPLAESINQTLKKAKAPVLAFETDNSWMARTLLIIYLFGLLMAWIRMGYNYFQVRRMLISSKQRELGGQAVLCGEQMTSPFSFGFLNPQIYIPSAFLTEKSQHDLDVIITHEQTHLKHKDPRWKLYSLLTRSLLYFSPSAFFLHRKLDLEMEVECDRVTISEKGIDWKDYGRILIEATMIIQNRQPNPLSAYMSDTNLKRRIQEMKTKTMSRPLLTIALAGVIVGAAFTTMATTIGILKWQGQYRVETEILFNGKVISRPQFIVIPNSEAVMEVKSDQLPSELQMKLVASESTLAQIPDGIELKMAVQYKTQGFEFQAKPHVIVKANELATVMIGSSDNNELEMKIKTIRQ